MVGPPPGFGVRQPSGDFEIAQSGRGLPQSQTLARVRVSGLFPAPTIGHDRARRRLSMKDLRRTNSSCVARRSWRLIAVRFCCRCHFSLRPPFQG